MSVATYRQKALIFILLLRHDLVFPLRGKAPNNGKTAVSQKKNRASLFSVDPLDYCRNSGKRFRASRIRNTDDFVLRISGCRGGIV